jgi:hypothetical protein
MRYHRNQATDALCFACTYAFRVGRDEDVVCPRCQHVEPRRIYEDVMERAAMAVRFGYQYPAVYARDRAAGHTNERYCLVELPPVVTWIALAALSGVVGNATFDAIKAAVRRIVNASTELTGALDPRASESISEDTTLRDFCSAVQAYDERLRLGLPDPDPLVWEERLVDLSMRLYEMHPEWFLRAREMDGQASEELRARLVELTRELRARDRHLAESEMVRIWRHLDSAG